MDAAKSHLAKAAKQMKKFVDRKVEDLVLVKFNPRQFKALRGVNPNLVRNYEGPFRIITKVGKISYRQELPQSLKVHPVFYVSILKSYHKDKDDPS